MDPTAFMARGQVKSPMKKLSGHSADLMIENQVLTIDDMS
jgi:hypothetical protein